jgi:hypothetical protein
LSDKTLCSVPTIVKANFLDLLSPVSCCPLDLAAARM